MGNLVVPQIHLKKVQSSGFFYVNGMENGRGKRGLTTSDIWTPAGIQGRLRNFFVLSLLTLVDVSPVIIPANLW